MGFALLISRQLAGHMRPAGRGAQGRNRTLTTCGEQYGSMVISVGCHRTRSRCLSAFSVMPIEKPSRARVANASRCSRCFQGFFLPQDIGRGRNPNDPDGPPLGFVLAADRGPSVQDQRHRLTLNGLWTLKAGVLVSSIVTVGSGPITSWLARTTARAEARVLTSLDGERADDMSSRVYVLHLISWQRTRTSP